MLLRRLVCLVALGVVALALPGAPAPAKILDGCAVLGTDELEAIFEQPFAKGDVLQGDYCQFHKPSSAEVPNILVEVLVNRSKTAEKAKQAYRRAVRTSTELAGGVIEVPGIGDEAFSEQFLGTDQVVVRSGRVIGRFRVDEPDSDDAFPDQVRAVALAGAPRLANYSKAR